jgi:DNA-binding transcriptional MerR regulator
MSSVAELSDAPKYNVKAVCAQTGIRPVTLRAWECRYSLLTPHRTNSNYRLYSERDVAVLRWLKLRVDAGQAISAAVTEYKDLRRNTPPAATCPALSSAVLPVSGTILAVWC